MITAAPRYRHIERLGALTRRPRFRRIERLGRLGYASEAEARAAISQAQAIAAAAGVPLSCTLGIMDFPERPRQYTTSCRAGRCDGYSAEGIIANPSGFIAEARACNAEQSAPLSPAPLTAPQPAPILPPAPPPLTSILKTAAPAPSAAQATTTAANPAATPAGNWTVTYAGGGAPIDWTPPATTSPDAWKDWASQIPAWTWTLAGAAAVFLLTRKGR